MQIFAVYSIGKEINLYLESLVFLLSPLGQRKITNQSKNLKKVQICNINNCSISKVAAWIYLWLKMESIWKVLSYRETFYATTLKYYYQKLSHNYTFAFFLKSYMTIKELFLHDFFTSSILFWGGTHFLGLLHVTFSGKE